MTIAVNTRSMLNTEPGGAGYFLHEILKRITVLHPEHLFVFIFDRPYTKTFDWPPNVRAVVMGPPVKNPLLLKFWYDYKIPSVLKKNRANIFISADGFCSLRTGIPQCMVINDLEFLHFPEMSKRSHLIYNKRYTPKCILKARTVVTVSQFSKKDIIDHYMTDADKIHVIYKGVHESFQPLEFEQKLEIRKKYTDGKEFFLYAGAIHPRKNLVNLLKAFSIFKKRQQAGMKLVIAGHGGPGQADFLKSLETYKYRDDVLVTGYLEINELSRLMGAAYGLVYPSLLEGFGMPVAEAMRCGVPVITSRGTAMEEIASGAAMLADPQDPSDMASRLMMLYKDEDLRSGFIRQGREVSLKYRWDHAAMMFWDVIRETVAADQNMNP